MPARRPYSYLTPKAEVRSSPLGGFGVFAAEPIPRHELVAFWSGHAISYAELQALPGDVGSFPVQVWFDTFFGPTTEAEIEPVDYMNHSCEPTCGVVGSVAVVARRDIGPDEELTFDYGTTDTVGLELYCTCGAPACRRVVTSDDWKDPGFRAANEGYLSIYILELVRDPSGASIRGVPPGGIPALNGVDRPGLNASLRGPGEGPT